MPSISATSTAPHASHKRSSRESLLPGTEAMPLRQLFGTLTDEEFAVAGRALGLTAWDRDHRHCGRCGAATERSTTERVRTCPGCGHGAYPRLSPAVIVLVERDGRACSRATRARGCRSSARSPALSRSARRSKQTVAREIREEAGIELADIRYFGSQPWPFTGSLMIGFTARWAAGDRRGSDGDLRGRVVRAERMPVIPPKLSIARELIDDFVRRHA